MNSSAKLIIGRPLMYKGLPLYFSFFFFSLCVCVSIFLFYFFSLCVGRWVGGWMGKTTVRVQKKKNLLGRVKSLRMASGQHDRL